MKEIPADTKNEIDGWLAKFPEDRRESAIMPALMAVQKINGGWLSNELMDKVAEYLNVPKVSVYENASFYTLFELAPVGKNKIELCTNVSCMLRGSDKMARHLKKKLAIDWNETTQDGKFTLKEAECLACCNGAPMMQVNGVDYTELTEEKIDRIVEELAQ